jgi:hypothetical protein
LYRDPSSCNPSIFIYTDIGFHTTTSESGITESYESLIDESRKKFDRRRARNVTKIQWARVLCQAIHEYGILLKLKENDDLLERIERIEKELL